MIPERRTDRFHLGLPLSSERGDSTVPVGALEALVQSALSQQDIAVVIEGQGDKRAVTDAVTGVRIEMVYQPLLV